MFSQDYGGSFDTGGVTLRRPITAADTSHTDGPCRR